jgi:hypothetical protein
MRINTVTTIPLGSLNLKIFVIVPKTACLYGTSRCTVFRIKINNQRFFAYKILNIKIIAICIYGKNLDPVAYFQFHFLLISYSCEGVS